MVSVMRMTGRAQLRKMRRRSSEGLLFGSGGVYYCDDVGCDVEGRFGEEDEAEGELRIRRIKNEIQFSCRSYLGYGNANFAGVLDEQVSLALLQGGTGTFLVLLDVGFLFSNDPELVLRLFSEGFGVQAWVLQFGLNFLEFINERLEFDLEYFHFFSVNFKPKFQN